MVRSIIAFLVAPLWIPLLFAIRARYDMAPPDFFDQAAKDSWPYTMLLVGFIMGYGIVLLLGLPTHILLKTKRWTDLKTYLIAWLCDAVVAVKGRNGPSMTLLDIVAPSIPSLEEIVSALGYAGVRINVHLTPDRLSWAPEEQNPIDNGYMVRGVFAPEGQTFMLSDMRI